MISKRIHCKPQNDSYARLANYIAGKTVDKEMEHDRRTYIPQPNLGTVGSLAEKCMRRLSECDLVHRVIGKRPERESESLLSFNARTDRKSDDGLRWNNAGASSEKCLTSWCAGCWAGDDYRLAMQEVADTQVLNTRTTKEKTYHLVVSFRPEDQSKLTPETFKAIEERFAAVLGYSEHQRHCGVHQNTGNLHLHIAYNMIHPEKLTRVEPWRDYIVRDKVCRELEKEFGLVIDNGRDQNRGHGIGSLAATMEAHNGQQSFESYAQSQGAAILEKLESARTWDDVHQIFARHGLELTPRGAGLVVKDRHGKQYAKASTVSRSLSLQKLERRFGRYQKTALKLPQSEIRYGTRPIQRGAEEKQLWAEFQAVKQTNKAELETIREKWRKYRAEMQDRPVGKKARAYALQLARQKEAEEKHRLEMKTPGNWLEFLQGKALEGDENALAVLRSRREESLPDPEHERQQQAARAELLARKTRIAENTSLNSIMKKRLTSQAIMESLAPGVKTDITRHGHILFTLPDGKIIDTGNTIKFSDTAKTQALAYMSAKWGVKRIEKDSKGQSVFVLFNNQKINDNCNNNFVKPKYINEKIKNRKLER